jgi:hypothetical protein
MQIHEITRKQLNEVDLAGPNGLWSNIKTAGQALMQPGGTKDALRTVTPGAGQGATNTAAQVQSDFAQRMKAVQNDSATAQVAKNLQGQWEQFRAKNLATVPVNQRGGELTKWFQSTVVPRTMASQATEYTNPQAGPGATVIRDALKQIQDAEIQNDDVRKKIQTDQFVKLVGGVSVVSQELAKKQPGAGAAGAKGAAGLVAPKASSVGVAKSVLQKSPVSMPPSTLAAVEQITGTLPPVKSTDPTTINYLKALGFNAQ